MYISTVIFIAIASYLEAARAIFPQCNATSWTPCMYISVETVLQHIQRFLALMLQLQGEKEEEEEEGEEEEGEKLVWNLMMTTQHADPEMNSTDTRKEREREKENYFDMMSR